MTQELLAIVALLKRESDLKELKRLQAKLTPMVCGGKNV